jgi:hypothetical protein
MIDTICLLIPKSKVRPVDSKKYNVPLWHLHSKTAQYDKYVRNPPKRPLGSEAYFPRLTGYKRKNFAQETNIRIEFSAPKLLYLNNLDELEKKDFPQVVSTLQARLREMGLIVSQTVIRNASVSSVHFSKNIQLEDGYTANHLISEMNKINLRKSFDFARARYINDGQSLYAHTTSHQLIIYDKIADLAKGKNRSIDKEQTPYQQSLFGELGKKKELVEILRFEVRLNHKQKMNKLLEQLGYAKNPSFKEVFNPEMSQKVVSHYWQTLIKERNLGLFSLSLTLKDALRALYLANKELKPKQAIYLLGLFMLAKDENGMRELRSIVSKNCHQQSWYRLAKDVQLASELITKNRVRDWVLQVDNKLAEYEPYKHKVIHEQVVDM